MIKKVLALTKSRKIVSYFKDESEYIAFQEAITREVMTTVFTSFSLERLINLWHEYNNIPIKECEQCKTSSI